MKNLKNKRIKHLEYKIRFLIVSIMMTILLFFAISLIRTTNASYKASTNLAIKPDFAAFIFQEEMFEFNMKTTGIKPQDEEYVYSFTVSNYNNVKKCDVDLTYTINISTTTNLPLEYKLYKDEDYTLATSTNLLTNKKTIQDEDNSWYNEYTIDKSYDMYYSVDTKHVYYLVVKFNKEYGKFVEYADLIDNIRINIVAKQMVIKNERG